MAQNPVSELYQRYKIGTKKIVQWLAETAQRLSCLEQVDTDLEKRMHQSADGSVITLTTKELSQLAVSVAHHADAERALDDVDDILVILKDVIAGRKEYTVWRKQSQKSSELKGHRGHEHFVTVLQSMLQHLSTVAERLHLKRQAPKKTKGTKKQKKYVKSGASRRGDFDVLRNIFGALDVEETSLDVVTDHNSQSPTPLQSPLSKKTPDPREFQLEQSETEVQFAFWCLMKDNLKVREYLKSIWTEYYAGSLSLDVVSHVTETAFRLLQQSSDRFTEDFPDFRCFTQVAKQLEVRIHMKGNDIEHFSHSLSEQEGGDVSVNELLCIPAFTCLTVLREVMRSWNDGDRGVTECVEYMQSFASMHPFCVRVFNVIMRIKAMPEHFPRLFNARGFDNFTPDLVYVLSPQSPLLIDVVMKFQIYMDIIDAQTRPEGQEFQYLYDTKAAIQTSFSAFEQKAPTLIDSNSFQRNFQSSFRKSILNIVDKIIDANATASFPPGSEAPPTPMPLLAVWFLFLPAFPGQLAAQLSQMRYVDGVFTCYEGFNVMATAHLYRACLSTGLLKERWEDMDFVIDQVGPRNLGFIDQAGSCASTLLAARRFGMAFGIEAKQYSKERQRGRAQEVLRVPLPKTRHIARAKFDRIPKSPYLTAWLGQYGASRKTSVQRSLQAMAQGLLSDTSGPSTIDDSIRQQWLSCGKLEPDKLLQIQKHQLIEEEVQTHFDFHHFFIDCSDFLRQTKESFSETLDFMRAAMWRSESSDVVDLVDDILWTSAAAENLRGSHKRNSSPLAHVAEGMKRMIDNCGSEGLKRARNFVQEHKYKGRTGVNLDFLERAEAVSNNMSLQFEDGKLHLSSNEE